jgi:hypothetical protein
MDRQCSLINMFSIFIVIGALIDGVLPKSAERVSFIATS